MSETRFVKTLLVIAGLAVFAGIGAGRRGDDDDLEFEAVLTGANEVPPNASETTGKAELEVNSDQTMIEFELEVEDGINIFGEAGAHIHCGAVGVNGPIVAFFAARVQGGFDGRVQVEATLTAANIVNITTPCGATLEALVQSMRDGNAYVNVHTNEFPGGVIRGQIEED